MPDATPTITDEAWEAFCRNPDEGTFAPVYEQMRRLVYTICRRILRNEDDTLDAFQSTYCRLLALAREAADEKPTLALEPRQLVTGLAVREADSLRKRRQRRRSIQGDRPGARH
ncbi:hypothetical protein ACFL34_01860 [Candidatus Sumerlaeota bacterium]